MSAVRSLGRIGPVLATGFLAVACREHPAATGAPLEATAELNLSNPAGPHAGDLGLASLLDANGSALVIAQRSGGRIGRPRRLRPDQSGRR
jgi:hypothetical protein